MINCEHLYNAFLQHEVAFFTGVPDSLLKDFCAYIADNTSQQEHIITANEGAAIGLASGYHLATDKIPLVYLQNSGLGNTINPLLSLADKEVYSFPMILMIGWRGEPGIKDEPQHIKQGRVQNALLEAMEIPYHILDAKEENVGDFVKKVVESAQKHHAPVAIVVRKNSFEPYQLKSDVKTHFEMSRERAIETILETIPADSAIVSTTGKTSREVFEFRARNNQGHQHDFLTVGSMGHCSQIALGVSLHSNKRVFCLDGDGATIMHMGSLAVIADNAPDNFVHIVFNNGAHDSVGGQPTVGFQMNLVKIALGSGYKKAFSIENEEELKTLLREDLSGPVFIEVKVNKGARKDLGRPTTTPKENKEALMNFLKE